MTPRIRPRTPDELSDDERALYAAITGGPPRPGSAALRADPSGRLAARALRRPAPVAPLSAARMQELGAAIRYGTQLDDRAREIAILLVAARQDSAFERESHEAVARAIGFTSAELAALREERVSAFSGDDALVASVVVALLDGDLDETLWDAGIRVLSARAVFELSALVGYYRTLALQLRVFRVDGVTLREPSCRDTFPLYESDG